MWFDNLLEMKKTSKKTIEDIYGISGVPKGTLNKLFSGQTKDPQISTIEAVVRALGFTLNDLFKSTASESISAVVDEKKANDLIQTYKMLNEKGKERFELLLSDLIDNPKFVDNMHESNIKSEKKENDKIKVLSVDGKSTIDRVREEAEILALKKDIMEDIYSSKLSINQITALKTIISAIENI